MIEIIEEEDVIKQGNFIIRGRKCSKCGGSYTYIYKGQEIWYIDPNFEDEEKYLCSHCYGKTETPNKKEKFFEGRICNICRETKTSLSKRGMPRWTYYREDNGEIIKDRFVCYSCQQRIYRKMPDSYNEANKLVKNWRTGNLDINSSAGKGFICEAIVMSIISSSNANMDMDNFRWYYDLEHEYYKRINVKGNVPYHDMWIYETSGKENFDTYFLLGYDENRENIESVHIIPNKDWIYNLVKITIVRTPSRISKYDQFKVDPKPYNNVHHDIMDFLEDKKYFGIKDIKKWLCMTDKNYIEKCPTINEINDNENRCQRL